MPFDFTKRLFVPEGELIGAPSGELMPTGFVGPWAAYRMRMLRVVQDVKLYNADVTPEDKVEFDDFAVRGDNWLYFLDDETGLAKARHTVEVFNLTFQDSGRPATPNPVWRFRTNRERVISFSSEEARKKWGDLEGIIAFDVVVQGHTKRAWRRRHQYQLISLPSAVAAYARYCGEPKAQYDLSELLSEDTVFTDEFHHRMTGGGGEDDDWIASVLGQRRDELWKMLGEDNVRVFNCAGVGTKKYQAQEGTALNECLKVASAQWPEPIWCKLMQVPDPKPDALTGDGARLNRPAIFDFYADGEAAQAALDAERAGFASPASGTTPMHPPLPADWEDLGLDEWVNALRNDTRPPVKATGPLSATVDDIVAWREYLNAVGD